MPNPRDPRVWEIFLKVKSAPPAERASTLDEIGSRDNELREEVERLLASEEPVPSTVGVAEPTPWSTPAKQRSTDELCGQTIGDYELLSELGRGGMGVVFQARQMSLDRFVAFKVIRADRDVTTLSDRFRREAESAAMLDHPNIVPIYEIGEVDQVIYFSMKLVDGDNLDRMLKSADIGLERRVQWLATVARAVHYSHQNGILHRDLKPGNILIDRDGIPYVTDFGLAKQIAADVTVTQTGVLLGTPAYMSPEQAKAGSVPVMTTSDIYSLGAILYEAITNQRLVKATSLVDAITQVTEGEPVRPRSLNSRLDPDLEQICLTCLRKHPEDRYASADALADDLESWLRGEPVRARPLSGSQRLWRWCRRRPAAAATWAAAAMFVAVAVGLIVWKWAEAERQTVLARTASVQATAAGRKAQEESQRAKEHFETAREAVTNYVMLVDDDIELQRAGLNNLRLELLESAMPFFEDLIAQEPGDERAEAGRVEAYFRLGKIHAALGKQALALDELQNAIQGYRALVENFPENRLYLDQLAGAYNDVALLHESLGDDDAAADAFGEAIRIQEALVADSSADPQLEHVLAQFANNLGTYFLRKGETGKARQELELAREIHARLAAAFPNEPLYESDLARHLFNLGSLCHREGDLERSKEYYLQSSAISRQLTQRYPTEPEHWQSDYETHARLAVVCFEQNAFDEAAQHYVSAIEQNEALVRRFPGTVTGWIELARNRKFWAIAQQRTGALTAAQADFETSVRDYQAAIERLPAKTEFQDELAQLQYSLASVYSQLNDLAGAEREYEKVIAFRQQVAHSQPSNQANLVSLGGAQCNRGTMLRKLRRADEALAQLEEAVTTLDGVVQENPSVPRSTTFLINSLCQRAIAYEMLNRYPEAVEDWRRGNALDNNSAATAQRLTIAQAIVLAQQGQVNEAVQTVEQLLADYNQNPSILFKAASVYCHCGNAAKEDQEQSESYLDRAIDCLRQSQAAGYLTRSSISEQLRTHVDFEPLRQREDFRSLVDSL